MNVIQGNASKVRFSTDVSGNGDSASTTQVAVFELDGQHVELKIPDSIIIGSGDFVAVAGQIKNGLFKAVAYKNITIGISGKNNPVIAYFVGVVFLLVGLATLFIGLGLIFASVGLFIIYYGRRYSVAYNLVKDL